MPNIPTIYIGYTVLALTAVVCMVVGTLCVMTAIRLIRRQIKLHHSIRLVELKSVKLHFIVFLVLDVACAFFAVLALTGGFPSQLAVLERTYGMTSYLAKAAIASVLLPIAAIGFLLVVLFMAKSAVVDKGIYVMSNYLDWYHVHDYIIDESAGTVTLSTCRDTFATVRGTTAPLRVTQNDIPKLKFILNRNKNKFSA